MQVGQLIEYNTRNIFLEKLYTKYGGETSPRVFSKNEHISGSTILNNLFLLYVQVEGYRNILQLR